MLQNDDTIPNRAGSDLVYICNAVESFKTINYIVCLPFKPIFPMTYSILIGSKHDINALYNIQKYRVLRFLERKHY